MKRRRADRPDWERIMKRRFFMDDLDSDIFTGVITLLCLDQVQAPSWKPFGDRQFKIIDDGFSWLQHYPIGSNYIMTTMFNEHGQIVQHYIDICTRHGLDSDGVPWFEDLYLDIKVLPTGEYLLMDQSELETAYQANHITQLDYDLAWQTANGLIDLIASQGFPLFSCCSHHRGLLFGLNKV
ncbi:MAG: DUF402 domain-containing protein [Chloroflexota bacterium]